MKMKKTLRKASSSAQGSAKQRLRERLMRQLRLLSGDRKKMKDTKIKRMLSGLQQVKDAGIISCYVSKPYEVGTRAIIKELLRSKKKLAVPVARGDRMLMGLVRSVQELKKQKAPFGIAEPKTLRKVGRRKIEVVITPGIAFSREGYRLGHGKGYYDRFLKKYCGTKIGLAYSLQIVQRLPKEANDVPVDLIVTEEGIINAGATNAKRSRRH